MFIIIIIDVVVVVLVAGVSLFTDILHNTAAIKSVVKMIVYGPVGKLPVGILLIYRFLFFPSVYLLLLLLLLL